MADIGDNGGPPLEKWTAAKKIERIKQILDTGLSAAQKCIGVGIVAHADTDGIAAEMSTVLLQTIASVKDRETVYRATDRLEKESVAAKIKKSGAYNSYRVIPARVMQAVEDAYNEAIACRVKPDMHVGSEPTGMHQELSQVEPDMHVGPEPTGTIKADGLVPTGRVEPDAASQVRARVRDTVRAESNINNKNNNLPNKGGVINAPRVSPPSMAFEGERLSFSDEDVRKLALAYSELQFPQDLRKAERAAIGRLPRASDVELLRAIEDILREMSLEHRALTQQVYAAAESKDAKAHGADCFIGDGKIQVANGFEAELLREFADGDPARLRNELDRIGQYVKMKAKGEELKLSVRAQLAKQRNWTAADRSRRGAAAGGSETETDIERMARLAGESAKQSQQQKGRRQ